MRTLFSRKNIYSLQPLIGFLLFVAITFALFIVVDLHKIDIPKQGIEDYQGRLYWILSVLMFFMAGLYSLDSSVENITSYFPTKQQKINLIIFSLIVIVGGTVLAFLYDGGGTVGKALRESIKSKSNIDVQFINNLIKAFAGLIIVFIIANVTIMHCFIDSDNKTITEKSRAIKKSFHSSSAFLAIAIIEIYFLYSWGASCAGKDCFLFATSKPLILGAGIFYTLMLMVVYIPLFKKRDGIFTNIIYRMEFKTQEELSDWCAVNVIEEKTGKELADALTFFSPIISGVCISIISKYL